jgi:hypothetical protein
MLLLPLTRRTRRQSKFAMNSMLAILDHSQQSCWEKLSSHRRRTYFGEDFPETRFVVQIGKRHVIAHAHQLRLMLLVSTLQFIPGFLFRPGNA